MIIACTCIAYSLSNILLSHLLILTHIIIATILLKIYLLYPFYGWEVLSTGLNITSLSRVTQLLNCRARISTESGEVQASYS